MVSKKGYIKTLEAVVAIILVIMVSYTLIPQSVEKPPEPPLALQDAMQFMNQQIERDQYTREKIVPYNGETSTWGGSEEDPFDRITSFVTEATPNLYDFSCAVCSSPNLCIINTPLEKNVYVTDVFIASGGKEQNPKIVRVWLWEKLTGDDRINFRDKNSLYYNKCYDCISLNKKGKLCTPCTPTSCPSGQACQPDGSCG